MNKSIRFINFLIDSLAFFLLVFAIAFLLRDYVAREELKYYMIALYYLYYFVFELTTGQTLGKIITKTKVIDVSSQAHPAPLKILLRTFGRLIPWDFISFLITTNGVHDSISNTRIIKK